MTFSSWVQQHWIALSIIAFVAVHVYLLWRLWVYYIAVTHFQKVRDSVGLPDRVRIPAGLVLVKGYALDFYCNMVPLTIVSMRLPRETTVSSRLKKYNKEEGTWGKKLAQFAEPFLDVFDKDGDHI